LSPEQDSGGFDLPPDLNWLPLYAHLHAASQEEAKLTCLLHYFHRLSKQAPQGSVTIRRQVLLEFPDFKTSVKRIRGVYVREKGAIEDAQGALQVDFANRYIGGGVLSGGCVQEEIRFSIEPELMASMFLCEAMADNEAIFLGGSECYSRYKGYAKTLQYAGDSVDTTPLIDANKNTSMIIDKEVCAIDAIDYRGIGAEVQYREDIFLREIRKAYTGFFSRPSPPSSSTLRPPFANHDLILQDSRSSSSSSTPIATGNWGCGAFLGDREHKSLLQIMAASEVDRDLIYYTFGDKTLTARLERFNTFAEEKALTVGDVYRALVEYHDVRDLVDHDHKKDMKGVLDFMMGIDNDGEGKNCVIS
jgi:poly(ADP-ribose) glycohydrolase